MSRDTNRERLLRFLDAIRRPEMPLAAIREDENLIRAGLIDSLAVLEIIVFLETEFEIEFSATGLDPGRLTTVTAILDIIDGHAR